MWVLVVGSEPTIMRLRIADLELPVAVGVPMGSNSKLPVHGEPWIVESSTGARGGIASMAGCRGAPPEGECGAGELDGFRKLESKLCFAWRLIHWYGKGMNEDWA